MGNSASSAEGKENKGARNPEPKQQEQVYDKDGQPENMSYWQMARQGYQELVNAIIRPPRAEYSEEDLGPVEFKIATKLFRRSDLQLTNPRGMVLQCSHWEPVDRAAAGLPCLIYLHGNSSCRVEATSVLTVALCSGLTVFAFDFAGSGQSGGDWVSLGFYERDDLQTVTDYLRSTRAVTTIGLWGRSMGAATALLHGDRDPSIAGLVLDSAFADLDQLALEMVERGRQEGLNVPGFVVKAALAMIRSSVQKRAGFSTKELAPIRHADKCYIPALFAAAENDDFILPHHSQQIFDRYAGDKNIVTVSGDHNSPRPSFFYDSAGIFLLNALRVPQEYAIEDPKVQSPTPPWYSGNRWDLFDGLPNDDMNSGRGPKSRTTQDNGLAAGHEAMENQINSAISHLGTK